VRDVQKYLVAQVPCGSHADGAHAAGKSAQLRCPKEDN